MAPDPYRRAADALIALGRTLVEARAVRYQAPPRVVKGDPKPSNRAEVSNPTLDVVVDERRWELSSEVGAADIFLEWFAEEMGKIDHRLTRSLARWNNEEDTDGDDAAR